MKKTFSMKDYRDMFSKEIIEFDSNLPPIIKSLINEHNMRIGSGCELNEWVINTIIEFYPSTIKNIGQQ